MTETTTTTGPGATPVWTRVREAEHGCAGLDAGAHAGDVVRACTHLAPATSTVLVTVEVAGGGVRVVGEGSPDDVTAAAVHHRARTGGRAFVFAGCRELTGVMTVGELLARSDVSQVVMIGQREPVADDVTIDTQSFVRPLHVGGALQLVVRPAPGGTVVPFEQPDPTSCCADH